MGTNKGRGQRDKSKAKQTGQVDFLSIHDLEEIECLISTKEVKIVKTVMHISVLLPTAAILDTSLAEQVFNKLEMLGKHRIEKEDNSYYTFDEEDIEDCAENLEILQLNVKDKDGKVKRMFQVSFDLDIVLDDND